MANKGGELDETMNYVPWDYLLRDQSIYISYGSSLSWSAHHPCWPSEWTLYHYWSGTILVAHLPKCGVRRKHHHFLCMANFVTLNLNLLLMLLAERFHFLMMASLGPPNCWRLSKVLRQKVQLKVIFFFLLCFLVFSRNNVVWTDRSGCGFI